MPFDEISPSDAHQGMNDGSTYVDVRTVEEFEAGHPAGSFNIPIFVRDPATMQMALNEAFLPTMEKHFPKDTVLLMGCQVGGRSRQACMFLEQAGYTSLSNVAGGFGGVRGPFGQVVAPGWATSDLPVDQGSPEGRSFATLQGSE